MTSLHDASRGISGVDDRGRRVGSHAAGVGAAVTVVDRPLVVLRGSERHHRGAVGDGHERSPPRRSRNSSITTVSPSLAEGSFVAHACARGRRSACRPRRRRQDHALARRQAIGLDDDPARRPASHVVCAHGSSSSKRPHRSAVGMLALAVQQLFRERLRSPRAGPLRRDWDRSMRSSGIGLEGDRRSPAVERQLRGPGPRWSTDMPSGFAKSHQRGVVDIRQASTSTGSRELVDGAGVAGGDRKSRSTSRRLGAASTPTRARARRRRSSKTFIGSKSPR